MKTVIRDESTIKRQRSCTIDRKEKGYTENRVAPCRKAFIISSSPGQSKSSSLLDLPVAAPHQPQVPKKSHDGFISQLKAALNRGVAAVTAICAQKRCVASFLSFSFSSSSRARSTYPKEGNQQAPKDWILFQKHKPATGEGGNVNSTKAVFCASSRGQVWLVRIRTSRGP